MNRTVRLILGLFFIATIAVSGVRVTQLIGRGARLDVTDQQLYTLSQGTKNILQGLQQPLTLRLYYSKTAALKAPDQIRFFNSYFDYVRALLEEYARNSGGMVNLEIIDPRPYSQEELAAIREGLKKFPITEEESFFFGLVLQTQFGVTKTIDFFAPERQQFVEYDVSYLIDTAITRQKQKIGVLSSLPVMGDEVSDYMAAMMRMQRQQPKQAWGVVRQLKENYEVVSVPTDTEAISDVDLLFVIHPKDLPDKTQFAIDQFVLNGGRVVLAVDPYAVIDQPDPQQMQYGMQHDASSNLPRLLSAWGLEMPAMTFAGDRGLAVTGQPDRNSRPMKILPFLQLQKAKDCFNPEAVITSSLSEVTFMFPGTLKKAAGENLPADLEYTPLMQTSAAGNAWTASEFELMRPDYGDMMRKFRDGAEPVVIGYQVSGTFKSAFPDGLDVEVEAPADAAAEGENAEPKTETKHLSGLTEAKEKGSVIVVADVDFFSNLVAYRETIFGLAVVGDSSAFVQNSLEALAGSTDLISIRSRGSYKRPFEVVDRIEREAEARTAEEEAGIVAQIKGFEQQLNEKLQALGSGEQEIISQTIQDEKKDIEVKLHEAETRLREVQNQKVRAKDDLKARLRNFATLPGPALTLAIAVMLAVYRTVRRRNYIYHTQEPGSVKS